MSDVRVRLVFSAGKESWALYAELPQCPAKGEVLVLSEESVVELGTHFKASTAVKKWRVENVQTELVIKKPRGKKPVTASAELVVQLTAIRPSKRLPPNAQTVNYL